MRKQLLICCMILMLVCSSLSLGSTLNNIVEPNSEKKNSVQIPSWPVGTEWIYDVNFFYTSDDGYTDLSINANLNNLKCEVINDADYYNLKITAPLRGSIVLDTEALPKITITFKETELDGNLLIVKENLSIKEFNAIINGRITASLIPINLNVEISVDATPAFHFINFPFMVGDAWQLNSSFFNISSLIQVPGIAAIIPNVEDEYQFDFGINIFNRDAVCSEKINISTSLGLIPSYNISYDDEFFLFYSPLVGNIIRIIIPPSGTDYIDYSLSFNLRSTNYVMPGAPNTPNAPTGETQGKPDETYEYSAVTTDPENDQIYYLFDWGDGTFSSWIGPVDSGEAVTVSKSYEQRGNYNIYVKSKDISDNQSPWSNPLRVSMPRSKDYIFLSFFFDWFEQQFPQIYSFIDLIFDMK